MKSTTVANSRTASASAQVAMAKYAPFSRSAGQPTSAATAPAITAATGRVAQKFQSTSGCIRIAVVYAPMPKNATWPKLM